MQKNLKLEQIWSFTVHKKMNCQQNDMLMIRSELVSDSLSPSVSQAQSTGDGSRRLAVTFRADSK